MEQGWGMKEITPACPRCGSSNTKFCYYNNYSLTQPRYFCKGCRRYWTKGGSLRNIPVGGGCRKSRRCNRSSSSSSSASHLRTLNGQHLIGSTNTSMMMMMSNSSPLSSSSTTSSTIDLAVVYANFLNPKHRNLNQGKPSSSSELLLSDGNIDHHHQVVDHDFISVNPTFDISSINLGTTSHSMFNPTTKTIMAAADSSSNGQLLSSHDHDLLYLADDQHQFILHHNPKRTQFHSYDQEFTPLPNLHTSHGTTTCSNETASRNELINNISLPPLPGEEEHHQDTTVPPPPFQDSNLQLWDHHTPDNNNNYGNRDEHDVLQSITNGMTTDQEEKMEPTHHQFSYSSFIRDCWNPIDDFNHDVQTSNGSVAGATSTVTAAVVVTPTTSLL